MPLQMNQEQVLNLLKHLDATQDEPVKMRIFTQLGHECYRCHHLEQWIDGFKGDFHILVWKAGGGEDYWIVFSEVARGAAR